MLLALMIPITSAYAIAQPDNSDLITGVSAFTNTLEKGDLLVLTEYDIQYATIPTDFMADEAFFVQLLDGTDVIAMNRPYPFNQSGFNQGVASVYLSAAETLEKGLTDSNGDWASWGPTTFTSRIIGNPVVWSTIPADTQSLASTAFSADQLANTNEVELANKVMDIARDLEAAWAVIMISSDPDVLSDTGAQYFPLAIPELFRMVAGIQLISSLSATFPTPVPLPGQFATNSQDRYADTPWIQGGFDSLAQDTGLGSIALRAIFMLIIFTVVVGFAAYHMGSLGGLLGFVGVFVIGMPLFVSQGFLPWAASILLAVIVTLLGVMKITGRLDI